MTDVERLILENPALVLTLTALVAFAVHWQKGLTYREFLMAHRIKCYAFLLLDPIATRYGRPLVYTKPAAPNSDEYVRTVQDSPHEVAMQIDDVFSPHLIATAKRRHTVDGPQFAHSQWRQVHDDGMQTEVYLFQAAGGGTVVYAHAETRVEDPEGHLTDAQYPGDYFGAFASAYDDAE